MTTTWCRVPPAGIRAPAVAPTSASCGPPVSTTRSVSIGPVRGVDADDTAARGAQTGERAALPDVHAVRGERRGVGQHVAWRIDVAVARRIRRAERRARREAGLPIVDVRAGEPFHLEAQRALQRDPLVCLLRPPHR